MPQNLNPQFPYYLLLFLLTVIMRFIRAYRGHPKEDNGNLKMDYWTKYLYFGFELVNVSAGVFILLSEHAANYVASFMILYVILVVISFFLEDESVGERVKTTGNIAVSCIVLLVTCYAFLQFEGLRPKTNPNDTKEKTEHPKSWSVSVPYFDSSLNRNFATAGNPIKSVYITRVSGNSRTDAIKNAKEKFFSMPDPKPFVTKSEKNPLTMIFLETEAVVELVNPDI